jgi:hypothetical protein
VLRVFLDDAEDAGGRLASLLTTRHRRAYNPAVGVVDGHALASQRNNGDDGLSGGSRLVELDDALLAPTRSGGMVPRHDQGQ